jgi:Ser/Thr protein kinase RdoA (MazF antagonist)
MTNSYELSDEQQLACLRELGVKALAHWKLTGAALRLIKARENAVFRADHPSGKSYALRIHRYNYHTDVALHSELKWMTALKKAGIDVPKICPSANGRLFEVLSCRTVPEGRQVDMFEWIAGVPLGASIETFEADASVAKSTFRALGGLCACIHNQSAAWTKPEWFKRHAWDEEGLTGETPLWGRFWELEILSNSERRLIRRARTAVHGELAALDKASECYGVIHADLTPDNVLIQGDRLQLIDFDDAGFGWHLFEIATALYFHHRQAYYPLALDALIGGYREHRNLSDEAIDRLPVFMLARSLTYLGWVHTRRELSAAEEMTPMLVRLACELAENYLST